MREKWPRDYSCLLFKPSGTLRCFCRDVLAWPGFDQLIIAAIVASSICLGLDSPRLDPDSSLAHTLSTLDLFWTALFTFELSCKVIIVRLGLGSSRRLSDAHVCTRSSFRDEGG